MGNIYNSRNYKFYSKKPPTTPPAVEPIFK